MEFINARSEDPDVIKDYFKKTNDFEDLVKKIKELFESLEIDCESFIPNNFEKLDDYKDLKSFIEKLSEQTRYFNDYMRLLVHEEEIQDENAKAFYEHFNLAGIKISEVDKYYKYFVREAQKDDILTESSNKFEKYDGIKLESLRKKLNKLEEQVENYYQNEVANKIYDHGKSAPLGESAGKVSDKSEMGLIDHLTNIQSPRMSIRDFIGKAINAVPTLKPCFMMSPLTVSQILPLKEIFDVVIIDEASQMKPEFALGTIARAKQAIIVGDPKQLPPTSFYQATASEDEWDDDMSAESILDMAKAVFPSRKLLWHYRSRHEDLIKFSKAMFYENLLIPPTANKNKKDRGISYNYLDKATYITGSTSGTKDYAKDYAKGGTNPVESSAVVDAVIQVMKERPNESIGVATMNFKQKEFIQGQFDSKASGDTKVTDYLNRWATKKQGLEEFFIKNLENVQGDERDVIIISTVYGPNQQSGKVFQRFGPINNEFGERRLNVLFTRAKNEIKLFTSLKASDIDDSEKPVGGGLNTFKKYLTFVETGKLQEGETTDHEVESPFQQWAIDVIHSFPGFKAKHEIGVQGYRIDIGVEHENYPHGYIMAVETDGASYHSSKSARDRDKLRQEIIESHGWVFYRIWSTDWINNSVEVKERLKKALEDRLVCLKIKKVISQSSVEEK